jgi:glycosyltransferase involved in cell wall biosynthesis
MQARSCSEVGPAVGCNRPAGRREVLVLDVSVVVPTRNAEHLIEECLASVARSGPRETIVVDGMSNDGTLAIARRYDARIMYDHGRGLPAARMLGARAAQSRLVALIDADVVLPEGALHRLVEEFRNGSYDGLQAGLMSVSGAGYWGRALVNHHRSGLSKDWFGLVATIFDRDTLLEHSLDEGFRSGEDIELRWRLRRAGARIGVSRRTIVTHRFEDTFAFARAQWLADGQGFGRMLRKHGVRSIWLIGVPFAAAVRGIILSLGRRQPRWIPYYACFLFFNYVGLLGGLREALRSRVPGRTSTGVSAQP